MRINEYLETAVSNGCDCFKCSRCGHIYGPATGNVKSYAKSKSFPITKAGPMLNPWADQPKFELREYYCPGCASMFSVELNKVDAPVLWDAEIEQPS
jgi:acetone carboxylase gamma subunit